MKTEIEIKKHERAIDLLNEINQLDYFVYSLRKQIEIERSKPETKSFLFADESWFLASIESHLEKQKKIINEYSKLFKS